MQIFNLNTLDYSEVSEEYIFDVKRIIAYCYNQGLLVSPREAYLAWSNYSDSMAAGWLGLPEPYDDGESPWVKTLDECGKEIKDIVLLYNK